MTIVRVFAAITLLVPLAGPAAAPPAPMRATTYTAETDVKAYWISEKLDGVRGHWDGAQLWTRGGHRIVLPHGFSKGWPEVPMAGELWIGRQRFAEVSGIVRRAQARAADWAEVRFMVFDLPDHDGTFTARINAMRRLLAGVRNPTLRMIEQFRVADAAALQARLNAVVNAGGEGLMLHHGNAQYRAGRSDKLLKLKPHDDAEARVVGYRPGQGKYDGMMGALEVETAEGLRFALGSGFSDAERADPPPIGVWVTYRHNGYTANGIPRFARFLRVREGWAPESSAADAP